MDNIFRVLIILIIPIQAMAVPRLPNYSASRAGATTTYRVLDSAPYKPRTSAPNGSGDVPINDNYSVNGPSYWSNVDIPVGETIPAFKVNNPFSAADMANAAMQAIP
jgi:hypothetical protein